jgi:predicted transposase YbfD/YdcC
MKNVPQHTVRLQDGSLCNFRKRIWKHALPLISCFERIPDPRHKRGIRYSHVSILFIIFAAITCGCTSLTDCRLWALHNKKFLKKHFPFLYGIPDATTISYLLQKLDPQEVEKAYMLFLNILGIPLGTVLSFDGKTMRAVSGKTAIRHMLSLFSHLTHAVISQRGVTQKENEIPAFKRLLSQATDHSDITGCLFLADALHAQKDTAKAILDAKADYLLVVKGNQKDLCEDICFSLMQQEQGMHIVRGAKNVFVPETEEYTYEQNKRKRTVLTTVRVTTDSQLIQYIHQEHGWEGIQTIGMLTRTGTRTSKDGTIVPVDETIGIVSSRKLTAKQMAELLRGHWCIENNLHWVKDFVFMEDRQTLRSGNAPQVMSFMRSMVISLYNLMQLQSIADACHNFQKSKTLHYQFLKSAAII